MAQLELLLGEFGLRQLSPITQPVDYERDEPFGYSSQLNTPVYSALEVKAGSYRDENGNLINFPGLVMQGVLLTVSMQKNVVKTPVNGRRGTFKEYVSDGDYYVTVQGIFTSDYTYVYPASEVNTLQQILKAPVAVDIVSRYLNSFGIYKLVIENYELPQRPGHHNTQVFTLQCVSDDPFELEILD
jgi:hypothetical protein